MNCCRIFTLLGVLVFVCASAEAQTVRLTASVSETVTLSIAPTFTPGNVGVVSSGGNTVRITISGDDAASPVIRVPLLVRSNSGFKISAVFESQTAQLAQLLVTDAHATGKLVSPHIVSALEKSREVERDVSQPLLVLTGPRVSTGGTLTSPNNALQVTVLIRLKQPPPAGSVVHLTFIGQPVSLAQ
jgi:hypothetical protein